MSDIKHTAQSTEHKAEAHGSMNSYIIGFILSLVLTFAAYFLVTGNVLDNGLLVAVILLLAFLQLLVQLFYFLHLGQEKKPRWNLWFFLLTAMTILTVVVGALWIMQHLEYNHTKPEAVEEFILHDEGLDVKKQPQHDMHGM